MHILILIYSLFQKKILENYKKIDFYPNNFHEYLLGPEVGFSHHYTLGIPIRLGKRVLRPIQVYILTNIY